MRGYVGLISDFGWGPYAGVMAEVVSCLGGVPIHVDHSVPSFSVVPGAYIAFQAYRWLPKNSSLCVVVDPGVGTERRAIAIRTRNYYLVGPDNGVLYPAAHEDGIIEVYEIDVNKLKDIIPKFSKCKGFETYKVSRTFHGRDVFAPVATLLALGEDPQLFSRRINIEDIVKLRLDYYEVYNETYRFKVIYIDRFGNVTLSARILPFNISEEVVIETERGREVKARVARTFQDVEIGKVIVYLNSFGFIEVAVNQGSASEFLELNIGDEVAIRRT